MKYILLLFLFFSYYSGSLKAQEAGEVDSTVILISEIENSLFYKTGVIELERGNAVLNVPDGFKYLDPAQSLYVLTNLWGNPPDSTILGILIPEGKGVLQHNSWVFTINFEAIGFVIDDDASEIDYKALLTEQRAEFEQINPERISLGYPPIDFVSWASEPNYDKEAKVLHWAKELKFGNDSLNTLNYNLRVLGRRGLYKMNAIASMPEFEEVREQISPILASITFKDGYRYDDYNPKMDDVSEWTIGGLVAGKITTPVSLLGFLTKYWKLIALGAIALIGFMWKMNSGKKVKEGTTPSN